ncbi:MAG: hypothetical protein RBU37_12325 [Myxococcota bacterium]|nr:hypothetical protein [Myxococcota bacterium]
MKASLFEKELPAASPDEHQDAAGLRGELQFEQKDRFQVAQTELSAL